MDSPYQKLADCTIFQFFLHAHLDFENLANFFRFKFAGSWSLKLFYLSHFEQFLHNFFQLTRFRNNWFDF